MVFGKKDDKSISCPVIFLDRVLGHNFTIYDLKRSHRQAILTVKTHGFWTQTHTHLDTNSHTLDLRRFFVDPPMVFRKPGFLSYKTPHTIFGRPPYGSSKTMKFGTLHTVLAHFELPGSQICDPSHTFGCQDPTSVTPHTLLGARIQT